MQECLQLSKPDNRGIKVLKENELKQQRGHGNWVAAF